MLPTPPPGKAVECHCWWGYGKSITSPEITTSTGGRPRDQGSHSGNGWPSVNYAGAKPLSIWNVLLQCRDDHDSLAPGIRNYESWLMKKPGLPDALDTLSIQGLLDSRGIMLYPRTQSQLRLRCNLDG